MNPKTLIPFLLCGLVAPAVGAVTTLVNDSFNDGGRTDSAGEALDAAWWYRGTGTQLTVASGSGLTNAVSFNSNGNTNSFVAALPQPVTLATDGDYLSVSYNYSRSASGNFHSGLRVGFFDITTVPSADSFTTGFDAALGYTAELPSVGQSNGALRLREDTDPAANRLMDVQASTTGQLLVVTNGVIDVPAAGSASLPFNVTFTLTRVTTGLELKVGSSLDATTYSVIDTVSPYFTFNSIGFSQVAANQINYWDDILVTTNVPEPATYALLLGLGALGLVMWRRKGAR